MHIKRIWPILALLVLAIPATAQTPNTTPITVVGNVFGLSSLPGQAWTSVGDTSPVEHGNIQSEAYFEQDFVIASFDNGRSTFTPFVSVALGNDTYGYEWNNKVLPQGGGKLNFNFKHGIISFGGGYAFEARYLGANSEITPTDLNETAGLPAHSGGGFGEIQGWFGWQMPGNPKSRFPGSTWFVAGNIEPIERGNVIMMQEFQQGMIIARIHRVAVIPFGEATASADTERYDWENKVDLGSGVKLATTIHNIYMELGASAIHEDRFISGLSATGASFFFNTSFNWKNLFHRGGN